MAVAKTSSPLNASTTVPIHPYASGDVHVYADTRVQHEHNALEHQPGRMPLAPRMTGPAFHPGQQRLDHRPQLVSSKSAGLIRLSVIVIDPAWHHAEDQIFEGVRH